jgi:hypothetical protein
MVAHTNQLNELPQADIEIILDVLRSMTVQELAELRRDLFNSDPA